MRAIKAAGAAVLRRDRLAAVVVVETGLALHELFKGPVAAGSEVHRPSPPFRFRAKRKAAEYENSAAPPMRKGHRLHDVPFSQLFSFLCSHTPYQ